MRSFLFKKSANIEIAKYESDRQSVSESRMSNDKLASQLKKHSVLKVHLAPKVHFALKVHSALEVHAVKLSVKFFMVGLPPPPPYTPSQWKKLQNKQTYSQAIYKIFTYLDLNRTILTFDGRRLLMEDDL